MRFFRKKWRESPPVVFLGDSLTVDWAQYMPSLFGAHWLNRGVSGQRVAQMAGRCDNEIRQARAGIVHIMGGSNDLWLDQSPQGPDVVVDAIEQMLITARRAEAAVYLASVPPIDRERLYMAPAWGAIILPVNQRLQGLARRYGAVFVDYTAALGPSGDIVPDFSRDGVHLTAAGYAVMTATLESCGLRAGWRR